MSLKKKPAHDLKDNAYAVDKIGCMRVYTYNGKENHTSPDAKTGSATEGGCQPRRQEAYRGTL